MNDKLKMTDNLLQDAKVQMEIKYNWGKNKVDIGILTKVFHNTGRRKTKIPLPEVHTMNHHLPSQHPYLFHGSIMSADFSVRK